MSPTPLTAIYEAFVMGLLMLIMHVTIVQVSPLTSPYVITVFSGIMVRHVTKYLGINKWYCHPDSS